MSKVGMREGDTPLIDPFCHAWWLLSRADSGATALCSACQQGLTEVVAILIDQARADVNQANKEGLTPLIAACIMGRAAVVAKLLAANADKNQADNRGRTPLWHACFHGRLSVVQLLSSYGASRTFSRPAPYDTAEHSATHRGHHDIAAFLVRSRNWTALHHLEVLTPERALALLRAGADLDAADDIVDAEAVVAELVDAEPTMVAVPTPLSIARALAAAGRATEGTAAFLVLEAAKPWCRQTHRLFPAPARTRAAELMRVAQLIKRGKAGYKIDGVRVDFAHPVSVADVFEAFVMPHMVTRDYQPPQA